MNTGKKSRTPYRPRTVDSLIAERLKIAGAIVLEGPRACGKTRTGLESSNTAYFLDTRQTRALIEVAPDLIEALLKSGFPAQTELSGKSVRPLLDAYLNEVTHTDVFRIADLRTEPSAIAQLQPLMQLSRICIRLRKRRASCLSLQWYMTFWSVWNRLAERCGTTAIRTVRRLTRF